MRTHALADEWGWGTSFHFSPLLPGKSVAASESAHEARIGALLNLGPGKKALDAGCGVGGPMRTIAACTGAQIVGLTINDYQVERATYHNKQVCTARLCYFTPVLHRLYSSGWTTCAPWCRAITLPSPFPRRPLTAPFPLNPPAMPPRYTLPGILQQLGCFSEQRTHASTLRLLPLAMNMSTSSTAGAGLL